MFLHDPEEGLNLRIITDGALSAALQKEGLVLERSISLTNNAWDPAAEKAASALGLRQGDEAKAMLSTLGKFSVWRKKS